LLSDGKVLVASGLNRRCLASAEVADQDAPMDPTVPCMFHDAYRFVAAEQRVLVTGGDGFGAHPNSTI
jgi:hypothetical protein